MKKNLFGTDGIRTKVGQFPLDFESLEKLGDAIALWAQKKYGAQPKVLIGYDTRESCEPIKNRVDRKTSFIFF